ncbi:hypothetical protein GOP47_0027711 [Adiantum capillus-veneris]|nr:hypothetical protein GOP47_0027711 [Adiantum capillus-veneris]
MPRCLWLVWVYAVVGMHPIAKKFAQRVLTLGQRVKKPVNGDEVLLQQGRREARRFIEWLEVLGFARHRDVISSARDRAQVKAKTIRFRASAAVTLPPRKRGSHPPSSVEFPV